MSLTVGERWFAGSAAWVPQGRVCGGLDREMRKLPPSHCPGPVNTLPLTFVSASPYNCTPFICTFP